MKVLLYSRSSVFVSTKKTYWVRSKNFITGTGYCGPCKFGFTDSRMFAIFPFMEENWTSNTIGTINVDFYSIEEIR